MCQPVVSAAAYGGFRQSLGVPQATLDQMEQKKPSFFEVNLKLQSLLQVKAKRNNSNQAVHNGAFGLGKAGLDMGADIETKLTNNLIARVMILGCKL